MDGCVSEIKSIDTELCRLRDRIKLLTSEKLVAQKRLYDYMHARGLKTYDGILIEKIAPKGTLIPRMKQSEKKAAAIKLFEEVGIGEPFSFWDKLQQSQKRRIQETV